MLCSLTKASHGIAFRRLVSYASHIMFSPYIRILKGCRSSALAVLHSSSGKKKMLNGCRSSAPAQSRSGFKNEEYNISLLFPYVNIYRLRNINVTQSWPDILKSSLIFEKCSFQSDQHPPPRYLECHKRIKRKSLSYRTTIFKEYLNI